MPRLDKYRPAMRESTAPPFLNLHGAPDANCAGLLSQAQSEGASTTTHAAPKKANPAPKVH